MSSMDHEHISRLAIRSAITQSVGEDADARQVADAAIRMWYQVASQLTPAIGAGGFDALFGRSLHLTSAIFPWLGATAEGGARPPPLQGFRACLETRDASIAMEACRTLLLNFTRLLSALIGDSLVERLLSPVWAPSSVSAGGGVLSS